MSYLETKEAIEKLLVGFSFEQISVILKEIKQNTKRKSIFNNHLASASFQLVPVKENHRLA